MTASITYLDFKKSKLRNENDTMNNVMLLDTADLSGMYVVTDGINSSAVVASDENPVEAHKKAIDNGASDPVLVYIPMESEGTLVLCMN